MFSFFKKRQPEPEFDAAMHVGTDIHSHLLPGIDDGSQDINDTLAMVEGYMTLGFTAAVTTPHIQYDVYNNTQQIIDIKLEEVHKALDARGLTFDIKAAGEHYYDQYFVRKVQNGDPLVSFGANYVLFELPFINEPLGVLETVKKLQEREYRPVLAHPERYSYMGPDKLEKLADAGVLIQVNVMSFIGYYDKTAQKTAQWLVENEMVNFLGSDCHKLGHLDHYRDAMKTKQYQQALNLPLLNRGLGVFI